MADACEYLEYRERDADREFEQARPYCTVVDEFVQPMRADICARRYGLEPADHCEFYREHHDLGSVTGFEMDTDETDERSGANGTGDQSDADGTDGRPAGDAEDEP